MSEIGCAMRRVESIVRAHGPLSRYAIAQLWGRYNGGRRWRLSWVYRTVASAYAAGLVEYIPHPRQRGAVLVAMPDKESV